MALIGHYDVFCSCVIKFCCCLLFPALNMTSASSFQMLRGAVIIFTGLLSVAFLGRRLSSSQWFGILTTILGLVIVGLADFLSKHQDDMHKLSNVITGEVDLSCGLPYLLYYGNLSY